MNIELPRTINGDEYEIRSVDVRKDDENNYTVVINAVILRSIEKIDIEVTVNKPEEYGKH